MTPFSRLDPGAAVLLAAASTAVIVAVVALGAEVLARLLARRSAASRHSLYLGALLVIMASPALVWGVGRAGLVLVALPTERTQSTVANPPAPSEPNPPAFVPPSLPAPAPNEPRAEPIALAATPPAPIEAKAPAITWADVVGTLVAVWLVGVVVLGLRLTLGLLAMIALRRLARPIEAARVAPVAEDVRNALGARTLPPILEAGSTLAGPVTAGVFRPVVILPQGLADQLDPTALRDVLVHECAHALRRDGLVGLLQRVAALVFWPHPLIHRLNGLLSRAREEACDDFVLRDGDPRRFARTLLLLAESPASDRPGAAVVGLFERRWRLEDRVARILEPGRSIMVRSQRGMVLSALALLATAAVAVAAVRPLVVTTAEVAEDTGSVIAGIVVDEAGKPVAGATVGFFGESTKTVATGTDGRFALPAADAIRGQENILATTNGGAQMGSAVYQIPLHRRSEPVRVVLKPSRLLTVRVADATGKPVPGASVSVSALAIRTITSGTTDAAGIARLRLPADADVWVIRALKNGVGYDYFENYRAMRSEVKPPPPEVLLTLSNARKVKLEATDAEGKPVPGVSFQVQQIQSKPGKIMADAPQGEVGLAITDGSGVAEIGWLPRDVRAFLVVSTDQFTSLPIAIEAGGDVAKKVRLRRRVRLSGRVLRGDGSPASGVIVASQSGMKRTGQDGTYSLSVAPDRALILAVTDPDSAAKPINVDAIPEGQSRGGLDFRLIEGTRLHGRVSLGKATDWMYGRPAMGVILLGPEVGGNGAQQPQFNSRERLSIGTRVDAQGHYEVRLGPGEYELQRPGMLRREKIHVDGTGEVVRDFLDELPKGIAVAGRVIDATPGAGGRPVEKADVRVVATKLDVRSLTAFDSTDAAGRFSMNRGESGVGLYARTMNGALAGFALIPKDAKDVQIALAPTVTVHGRVVDPEGRPVSGGAPPFMVKFDLPDGVEAIHSVMPTRSDSEGRFQITGVVPGVRCEFQTLAPDGPNGFKTIPLKTFRPTAPGPFEAGDVVIPAELAASLRKMLNP
jgi:beta-lactamase regulating signal transducer with metallopeptidase domain